MWIEGASIGDGVVIEDNARIVFSILDKKVRIGEDATVMSWCVLGEEVRAFAVVTVSTVVLSKCFFVVRLAANLSTTIAGCRE